MKIASKLAGIFGYEKRNTSRNPAQWFVDWVTGGGPTASGVNVSEDSALKYTPFWAAVRVISGTVASLPFIVYKRSGSGKERAQNHRAYTLLHDRPNEYMDALTFIESRQAHVLTYGNGYAEIQRDGGGRPVALWPLLPDRVTRKIGPDGVPYYELRVGAGEKVNLPDYNVLHIKGLGFDGYTGYDVVSYHKEAIGYGIATKEYGSRFFGNGANPGGILKHPKALSDKARANIQESFRLEHEGLSKSHRLKILEDGLDWVKTGVDPEQAQALEVQKYTVDDCARIFNIPPHKIGSLERATFCLPADVEVYTAAGPTSIASVKQGELVWSLGEDEKWRLSRVVRSACTGKDEILSIRTTNRTIRANAKHKILVRRKYPNPKPGQGGYQRIKWKSEYIPAGELRIGDAVVTCASLPDYGLTSVRGRELTESFMEFCGLLLGDGNVYDGAVTIARAEDATYMNHYRKVIQACFVGYDGGNGRNSNVGVATRPVVVREGDRQTMFSSVLAAQELKLLGLSGTARTKSVPGWVFLANRNMRLAFLRGFLDADGSVDKKGRISYSSCNERMLSQIRHLCISCGVDVTNMRCQEGVTTLPNGKQKAFKQYGFTCSNPGANREIGSHDTRYIPRLQQGKAFERKGRAYPWHGGRGFEQEGCSLARIVSIEKEPAEPVYDLEVEGTHSFVANGVVVHNSNIEQQALEFVTQTMYYWFRKWEQECNYKLFMPGERGSYFCEILVDGLLRGDIQSRYSAYAIGKQWSILSTNDIREKENMNGIGPAGDVYITPLNMQNIEALLKPVKTPATTDDADDNQDDSEQDKQIIMVDPFWYGMNQWIKHDCLRIIRKQIKALQKPLKPDFYEKHREWALNILANSVIVYAKYLKLPEETVLVILQSTVKENITDGVELKESDATRLTELIMGAMENARTKSDGTPGS